MTEKNKESKIVADTTKRGGVMNKEITDSFGSIFRRTDSIFRKRCKDPFISKGLVNYIFVICDNEGIIADEVSKILCVDKGTTARAIAKLEENGYIKRVQDINDKRKYSLYSLPKSKEVYKNLVTISYDLGKEALSVLNEKEKEDLLRMITKVRNHVRDIDTKEAEE